MDSDRRLKRYRRKDYADLVGFPVEIVGRDGVVRLYDFGESVRMYERRMAAAASRYHRDDLVSAEQGHCRARIEQLRRSFFHLRGWVEPSGPELHHPEHAGELAGFLARVLRAAGRVDVQFTPVTQADTGASGLAELWYVRRHGRASGLLLYCYWPEVCGGRRHRAELEALLASLHAAPSQGDAERLVGFHEGYDCAFVLTGSSHDVSDLVAVLPGDEPDPDVTGAVGDDLSELVRGGDLAAALMRARWLTREQPWHRDAYVVGVAAALALERADDAEDLAFVGTTWLPDDALLRCYLGLARLRLGNTAAGDADLRAAVQLDPRLAVARAAVMIREALTLRLRGLAGRVWAEPDRPEGSDGPEGRLAAEVARVVRRTGSFAAAAATATSLGVVAALLAGVPGAATLGATLVVSAAGLRSSWERLAALQRRVEDLAVGRVLGGARRRG